MDCSKQGSSHKILSTIITSLFIISLSVRAIGKRKQLDRKLRPAENNNDIHSEPVPLTSSGTTPYSPSTSNQHVNGFADAEKLFFAKAQEINAQGNEYFRALTTGIWYYTAAVLVSAGWVFNSIKELTATSGTFQFKEILSKFPNLCFPVLSVIFVNQVYILICCCLSYLYFSSRIRARWINHQLSKGLTVEPPELTRLIPAYAILALSIIFVPLIINLLIIIRFPYWIQDIGNPSVQYIEIMYFALLIFFGITICALTFGALDIYLKYRAK
jgi:hypothetical protein